MNDAVMSGLPSRRGFLGLGAGCVGLALLGATSGLVLAAADPGEVTIENFSQAGRSLGSVHLHKLVKSEAAWKQQLSANSFEITRHAGTEAPFTGVYANNHADGLYRCICCNTALFDSRAKFESGTGWPSFYQPISRRNVVQMEDNSLGMGRTAVACALCDAHLGHVFDDGPKPTGLRYCMNSAALRFIARGSQQA